MRFLFYIIIVFNWMHSFAQVSRSSFDVTLGYPKIESDVQSTVGIAYGIGYNYYVTSHFSLRPFFVGGSANGDKLNGRITYNNQFKQFGATANINLDKVIGLHEISPRLNAWFQIGAGALGNNLSLVYDSSTIQRLKIEPIEFDQWVYAFNIGLSLNYYISPVVDFKCGFNINTTQAKYLTGYPKSSGTGYFRNDALEYFYLGLVIKPFASEDKQVSEWKHIVGKIEPQQNGPSFEDVIFADEDKDGVPDKLDQDKNTPFGVRVDSRGIAIDTDYDGIPDYNDNCPMQKGNKANNGCPDNTQFNLDELKNDLLKDSDNDGVIDALDLDNETPPGVKVDTKGIALDTDSDGVPDYKDNCPLTPGLPGKEGCPQ